MKARYTSGLGDFEVEAGEIKDLFRQLAVIQEVFGAETNCGVCGSSTIRLQHRKVDDYDFYELLCTAQGCRARFSFGQAKKGGALFPKRKDEDGKWLPHGGWEKYVAPGAEHSKPPQQQEPPPARNVQRSDAPAATAPRAFDGQTQERINRMAEKWHVSPAPVTLAALIAMMRDHCAAITGPNTRGAQEFEKLYRRFVFYNQTIEEQMLPDSIKQFMVDVWEAAQTLENSVGVPT